MMLSLSMKGLAMTLFFSLGIFSLSIAKTLLVLLEGPLCVGIYVSVVL